MSPGPATVKTFQNEPFDWERRWQDAAYLIEGELTDRAAAALAEVGLQPHVEYRAGSPTDVLWWDGALAADQWERVKKARALAAGAVDE